MADEMFAHAEIDAGSPYLVGEDTDQTDPSPVTDEAPASQAPENEVSEQPEAHVEDQPEAVESAPPKPSRLQQRFADLTRARDEARREAAAARAELERLRQGGEPTPEDEGQALSAFVEAAVAKRLAEERAAESRASSLEKAKQTYQDFDAVLLASDLEVAPHVLEVLQSSEMYGDLLYYLGKNEAEAYRLNALPPVHAARMLGKIEERLAAKNAPAPGGKAPARVTKAPEPITPPARSSAETAASDDIGNESISFAEYSKRMSKMERERRANRWG